MTEPTSKNPNLTIKTEEFINKLAQENSEPVYKLTPNEAREMLLMLQTEYPADIDAEITDTSTIDENGNQIGLRIVRPANYSGEQLPAILYLHGGGWVMGDKDTHDALIKKLSNNTNAAVIFAEYSKSPEYTYPQALNQAYSVLKYLHNNPGEFNIDNTKIAVAGDSAGGNMAAVLAMKTKEDEGPGIKVQALFYPVTDTSMDTESYKKFKDGPWLSKKAMEYFIEAYVPEKEIRKDCHVSPLKASLEKLKNLPPALIITAENDVLRDEGEAYAAQLDKAGVEVVNIRVNGTIHDFMMLNALQHTPQSNFAIIFASTFLKYFLNKRN